MGGGMPQGFGGGHPNMPGGGGGGGGGPGQPGPPKSRKKAIIMFY